MAAAGIIVTGDKELDRALARMEAKALKKLLPKAAKEAAKEVQEDYQQRAPVETGAMRDASVIRVRRYKHKSATGQFINRGGRSIAVQRVTAEDIGAKVIIDRKKLTRLAGQKKRGRGSLPWDSRRGGMFFYPAVVELGNRKRNGQRPLTKSLYRNDAMVRRKFISAMRALLHF